MSKNKLKNSFMNAFSFLWDEYDLKVMTVKKEDWGYFLEAKNAIVGIRIIYEYREAFVNVMIYKLIDGEILDNTTKAVFSNEKINGFSLDYIISYLNPNDLIKVNYPKRCDVDKENDFNNYLFEIALRIQKYAKNILLGDFSIFDNLDLLVKENYHTYYKNRDKTTGTV